MYLVTGSHDEAPTHDGKNQKLMPKTALPAQNTSADYPHTSHASCTGCRKCSWTFGCRRAVAVVACPRRRHSHSTPVLPSHALTQSSSPTPHHSSMPPSYQPPRWAPPRKHGLQLPLSRDQLGAMIMYPLLTTVRVCVCMETEEKDGEEEEEVD